MGLKKCMKLLDEVVKESKKGQVIDKDLIGKIEKELDKYQDNMEMQYGGAE